MYSCLIVMLNLCMYVSISKGEYLKMHLLIVFKVLTPKDMPDAYSSPIKAVRFTQLKIQHFEVLILFIQ